VDSKEILVTGESMGVFSRKGGESIFMFTRRKTEGTGWLALCGDLAGGKKG